MPDLMAGEFKQIHEAIEIAWDILSKVEISKLPKGSFEKIQKIEAAKELMVDLAGGNSR